MKKRKDMEYEVVVDGEVVATYDNEYKARKAQESIIRQREEEQIVEQLCIPAVLMYMFVINGQKKEGEGSRDYTLANDKIDKFLHEVGGSRGEGQKVLRFRRMDKVVNAVLDWAVANGFDTRKMVLICIELMCALQANDYVEYPEDFKEFIIDMQTQIEEQKKGVDGYEKIEKSAMKKAYPMLNVIQDAGYFRYEGIYEQSD